MERHALPESRLAKAESTQTGMLDTTRLNQRRQHIGDDQSVWLFGYGSLIWKADFPYQQCRPATITGWQRRFWQGSHDHRGTLACPGRVATLVSAPDTTACKGMAYRITGATLKPLDVREKNGYLREWVHMAFDGGEHCWGLVYMATADNEAFLGDAPLDEMAHQIASAQGPSGANRDYLLNLAQALEGLGAVDEHVQALAMRVAKLPPPVAGTPP